MDHTVLRDTLLEGLEATPLLDPHTHLDAGHLAARGLHDVLLYHMLVSDLVSAGCSSRERLPEDPSDGEAEQRLREAIAYLPHIRNTGIWWGARIILRDLYGWTEDTGEDNWRRLDAQVRERAADPAWPAEILRRAGIRRACTELWRRRDGSRDDLLQYSLEWAFFTRTQWGEAAYDIPLYELERAWNQEAPGAPLPVTLAGRREGFARTICSLDDVREAIRHYIERIPFGQVLSTAQHLSTDIHYRTVTDAEMSRSLRQRDAAGPEERDVYASYVLEAFLAELERHGDRIVYQFSIGAEPLPRESGSKLHQDTVFELAAIIERHPRLRFQAFLASRHANQALCTLARELPNFSLAGYWWHNFFPGAIRTVIEERLDMVAANKHMGFFSDAYCVEWAYAKAQLVRRQWAEVLAGKVAQGQYTVDEALSIARQVLWESPQALLGMAPP